MATSRTRTDGLLLGLTAAAAGTDATSYLGLGHVFPANMTGNTVLLGIGVATGDLAGASRSATALAAFVLAAAIVGAIRPGDGRSGGLAPVLGVEFVLLAAAATWWLTLRAPPTGAGRYGLVALVGAAMGAQSAAVRRLGVSGVTTTYITGTWTALATALGGHLRRRPAGLDPSAARQGAVVCVYAFSALTIATAFHYWHAPAALIPIALLAAATLAAPRATAELPSTGSRRTRGTS